MAFRSGLHYRPYAPGSGSRRKGLSNIDSGNTRRNSGLRPWQPGESGNPSGRPKGTRDLANLVLESTDSGGELVAALLAIVRGELPTFPGVAKSQVVRVSDQLKAVEILMDRAFGKEPQHLELGGAGATKWDTVLESWTDEDMMAVVKLRDQVRDGVIEVEGKVIED